MPEVGWDRILSEAAAQAALVYKADLAPPPEQRELTAISAIEDGVYEHREGVTGQDE